MRTKGNVVQGVVGSNVVYAPFQELGWTTPSGRKVEGRKFLRRALEENAERIFRLLGKVVSFMVKK